VGALGRQAQSVAAGPPRQHLPAQARIEGDVHPKIRAKVKNK